MDIVVKNLSKSFGDRPVLSEFDAVMPEGACTCIMGPSGCGKTTLLYILMGLLKADSGEITGVHARKSAVFQEDRLCEEFSAMANVRLVLNRGISDSVIEEHLRELGLGSSLRGPVRELSGGMKRRVAIARAVLAPGAVIFMDEALKGLDAETKSGVIEYIKRHTAGKTMLMVTHDPDEAAVFGGPVIKMKGAGSARAEL